MKNIFIDKIAVHLLAVIVFLGLTFLFFSPLLEGKVLKQHDITQFKGMSKEISDYNSETGEVALWTDRMFGGMPGYLISLPLKGNVIKKARRYLSLGIKTPASAVFIGFLGFYFLLVVGFKMDPRLAIVGAVAYGLSSYFFIISAAGHNTKANAISYMAPVFAGVLLTFRGRLLWGAVVTGIALSLQIAANHMQITYYTLLMILVFGVAYLIVAIKENSLPVFARNVSVLLLAVVLAVGSNITTMWLTWEYGKHSIRGESELSSDAGNKTSGLDKDYILNDYSYGIDETLNLMIPNFKGGVSSGFDRDSETYKLFKQNNVPNAARLVESYPLAYWGTQRFVSGPVYIGAIVVFLFLFSIFFVKGPYKWWLVSITVLSIFLAWGKNFMLLSNLFIDFFPGYNKFRTVSMILVIAELSIPLLGILGLKRLLEGNYKKDELLSALKYSLAIGGGISLFFVVFPGLFYDFSAPIDEQLRASGFPANFIEAIHTDRRNLMQGDAFRSLVFISLTAAVIYYYSKEKLKAGMMIPVIGLLIVLDLVPVNKRYFSDDNFETKRESKGVFSPGSVDLQILKDKEPGYRVMNLTTSTFNDAVTSYHHNSIGGYHGAKMRRYQELIEHQISKNNMEVMNMLNTRYFIVPGNEGQAMVQFNPDANGAAWFVDDIKIVDNADMEMAALSNLKTKDIAVVDRRYASLIEGHETKRDSLGSVKLTEYSPNKLKYSVKTRSEQAAVFSEIYYEDGWKAYINGVENPHFRVNYVLRGMILPAGEYDLEFEFHPKAYFTGEKISRLSSLALVLIFMVLTAMSLKDGLKKEPEVN